MTQPWQIKHPSLYGEILIKLEKNYPTLHLKENEDALIFIEGVFPIPDINDCFHIKIDLPLNFPDFPPKIWETNGRIPRNSDRHTMADGSLCVELLEAWWLKSSGVKQDLFRWLDISVKNFLLGQCLVELKKTWPFGEHDHGAKGILNFYQEYYQCSDRQKIRNLLKQTWAMAGGHILCGCKSGKKLRCCHFESVLRLRNELPLYVIKAAFNTISLLNIDSNLTATKNYQSLPRLCPKFNRIRHPNARPY